MNAELGHATYEAEQPLFVGSPQRGSGAVYSETTLEVIDAAVRSLVAAAFERASSLLAQHRELLEASAGRLLRQETLERQDLDSLRAELTAASKTAGHERAA
jgi:cell division protease FtsH